MATAGTANLTTATTTLFSSPNDGPPCTTFVVTSRSSSAGNAKVNVSGLHNAADFFNLAPGASQPFRCTDAGITKVTATSDSTATVDFGVVART